MSILEEICYGDASPSKEYFANDAEYSNVLQILVHNEERIRTELTDRGKESLEAHTDTQREVMCVGRKDAFIYGVRYGVRVVSEAFGATSI